MAARGRGMGRGSPSIKEAPIAAERNRKVCVNLIEHIQFAVYCGLYKNEMIYRQSVIAICIFKYISDTKDKKYYN